MAVRKTLEKAVAVLRLLEGGEGSAASGNHHALERIAKVVSM